MSAAEAAAAEAQAARHAPGWAPPVRSPTAFSRRARQDDWERCVLAELSDIRLSLSIYRARGVGSKRFARVALPRMKDERGWERFCFGDSACSIQNDEPDFDDRPAGWPPRTRLVLQFDAVMTQAVLAHHVSWLEAAPRLEQSRALWLYALLAHTEKPVHRDVEAVIRRLVLRLVALRSALPSLDDPQLPLLQILLVVAGRYFGQVAARCTSNAPTVVAQAAKAEIEGLAVAEAVRLTTPAVPELQEEDLDMEEQEEICLERASTSVDDAQLDTPARDDATSTQRLVPFATDD